MLWVPPRRIYYPFCKTWKVPVPCALSGSPCREYWMPALFFPRPGQTQVNSIFDTQRLAQLQTQAGQQPDNPQLHSEVAQQFESIFIQQILKYARQSASIFSPGNSQARSAERRVG